MFADDAKLEGQLVCTRAGLPSTGTRKEEEKRGKKDPIKFSKNKSPEQEQGLSPLLSTCQTTAGSCVE